MQLLHELPVSKFFILVRAHLSPVTSQPNPTLQEMFQHGELWIHVLLFKINTTTYKDSQLVDMVEKTTENFWFLKIISLAISAIKAKTINLSRSRHPSSVVGLAISTTRSIITRSCKSSPILSLPNEKHCT